MSDLETLLADLRAGGRVDSKGEFTLDRAQARSKMRQFQLADPRRYVLELVQAAVHRGATAIDFAIDADDLVMTFDGAPFTTLDFDQIYGALFSRSDDPATRARRQLALGLNGALALNPARVTVGSGRRGGGARLILVPGAEDEIEIADALPFDGTRVHVRQRFRAGLLVEFVRKLRGTMAEVVHLRERARHCRIPIRLGDETISTGPSIEGAIATVPVDAPDAAGLAGFVIGARGAVVELLTGGVHVASTELDDAPEGFRAVVEGDRLRKNVSQTDFVFDEAHAAVTDAARAAIDPALAALAGRLDDDLPVDQRAALLAIARAGVARIDDAAAVVAGDPATFPAALADLPLWTRATGPADVPVSLRDLIAWSADGPVRHAGQRYEAIDDEGPVVLCDDDDRAALRPLLGRMADVGDRLRRARRRADNRRAWRQRPEPPVLRVGTWSARTDLAPGDGIEGQAGIHDLWRPTTVLRFTLDGCLLCQKELTLPIESIDAVVAAPFRPTKDMDDVYRNATTARAGLAVEAAALPLARQLADQRLAGRDREAREITRQYLRSFLKATLRDRFAVDVLVAYGFAPSSAAGHVARISPDPARFRPDLGLGTTGVDPIAQAGLFPDLSGEFRSLDEIARMVGTSGSIGAVGADQEHEATHGLSVLVVDDSDRQLLTSILGPDALTDATGVVAFERRSRQHMARQPESLRIEGPILWRQTVLDRSIAGEVAALAGHRDGRRAEVDVRILRVRRFLCERRLPAVAGPLRATVEATDLTPNDGWTDVADDDAWRRLTAALETAIEKLLEGIARRIDRRPLARGRPEARRLLRQAAGQWFAGTADDPGRPWLREVPLFETIGGDFRSLDDLAERPVEYVEATFDPALAGADDDRVLRLDAEAWFDLERILGSEGLVDASARLVRRARQRDFEARRALDAIVLPAGAALVSIALDEDPVVGEVGLSSGHGGDPTVQLHLCHRRRPVQTVIARATHAIVARLDDPRLTLTEDFAAVERDGAVDRLRDLCLARAPELLRRLADDWAGIDASDLEGAVCHVLDGVAAGTPGAADLADRLGLLAQTAGPLLTLADARTEVAAHGALAFVGHRRVGRPPEPERRVAILSPAVARRLAEVLPIADIGPTWDAVETGRARRAAAPALPDRPPADALASVRVEGAGLEGFLFLARRTGLAPRILFGAGGKEVESRLVDEALPCQGVVSGPGLVVGRAFDRVELTPDQEALLKTSIVRLHERLADGLADDAGPERIEGLRRALRGLSSSGALPEPAAALRERLDRLLAPAPAPRAVAARAAEPVAPPEPESDPVGRLIDALRSTLDRVAERDDSLFADVRLDRFLVEREPDPPVPVSHRTEGIAVHVHHPLVAAAGAAPDDPVPLALLAQATYAALNRGLEPVTDADEARFHRHLIERLAERLFSRRPEREDRPIAE